MPIDRLTAPAPSLYLSPGGGETVGYCAAGAGLIGHQLRGPFRLLRPVYRRIACQQLTQPGYGSDGIFAQSQQVLNDAPVKLCSYWVDSTKVEGLKLPVAEVAPDGLCRVQLPWAEISNVER